MRAASAARPAREQLEERFESARRRPHVALRPFVAWYTGYRHFMVRDPEGNRWSFGTYRGAPRHAPGR